MGTSSTTYFRSEICAMVSPILFCSNCLVELEVRSLVSNPAQISLKHSSQLTNKTTLATSFVFIRNVFHPPTSYDMGYLYEACDQIPDFCRQ
jgi:hypothetical protein